MIVDVDSEFWRTLGTLGIALTTGAFTLGAVAMQNASAEQRDKERLDREERNSRDAVLRTTLEARLAELREICTDFAELAIRMRFTAADGMTAPDVTNLESAVARIALVAPESIGMAAMRWVSALSNIGSTSPGTPEGTEASNAIVEANSAFMVASRSTMLLLQAELDEAMKDSR